MRQRTIGSKITLVGATLLLACPLLLSSTLVSGAHADSSNSTNQNVHPRASGAQAFSVIKLHAVAYSSHGATRTRGYGRTVHYGGISCVPFARVESGIAVGGNAWQWWGNAADSYARGATPEAGSVLAFRANGRMRLGHVAVVARVVNAREVRIDHANWPGSSGFGGVSQAIPVVDVSENNDWSAVRVGLGRGGEYGSVYPTYGFIYDRPATGMIEARRGTPTQQVAELNPVRRDLRSTAQRQVGRFEEVAEAPLQPRRQAVLLSPR